MGEVGCFPSSRASNLPLLLGKRNKFLATRCYQVQWFHRCLATAAAKKGKGHKLHRCTFFQGCKHRAGAVCPGCCPALLEGWGAGGARDHTGQPWWFYKCLFSSAVTEATLMAKFWMSLLWVNCLGPLAEGFGQFRKSELKWQLMTCCPRGRCVCLSSSPNSVRACSFART